MSILISIAALSILAPFSLVTGVFCTYVAQEKNSGTGFVLGFINAVGNLGAILAGH